MSEEHVSTGVENGSAAGNQEASETQEHQDDFNLDELLFGSDENTGDEEGDAADSQSQEQEGKEKDKFEDQNVEEAFAKRLKGEREKIREEEHTKIMQEIRKQQETTPRERAQGEPRYRDLSESEIQGLADDLSIPVELARILHKQQQQINNQNEYIRRQSQLTVEQAEYNEAIEYAKKLKEKNPALPEWDAKKLHQYRIDHYNRFKTVLPWTSAYQKAIAQAVESGEITRQTEQNTINKITTREDKTKTNVKSPETKKVSLSDLSKDDFDKLVEEVREGKYTRKE